LPFQAISQRLQMPMTITFACSLQLCRRRGEEVWWTTWAVATPGAAGVGRLPSRSKWGRYRPKNGFLLRPFLRSVAPSSRFLSWTFRLRPVENRPEFQAKRSLPSLAVPAGILFRRPSCSSFPPQSLVATRLHSLTARKPERAPSRKAGARNH
jgi:hypothetical protein